MMLDTTSLDAAQTYATRGWRVIPIIPHQKRPQLEAWQTQATTDPDLIRTWWTKWPNHGVGIATGQQSGIWALDIDITDGKTGDQSLKELTDTHGPLPQTIQAITGSGGRHIIFAWPNDGTTITNGSARHLGPGLDIRGEGGQIVAPPTTHPNGHPYTWEPGHHPDNTPPAQAPQWLLAILRQGLQQPAQRISTATTPTGDRPGDIFANTITWAELLTASGATHLETRHDPTSGHDYELWARPGANHTSATLGYRGSDVLKIFTSNWPGLQQDATYTKFGYYTALHHGGDHAAASAELGRHQTSQALHQWITNTNNGTHGYLPDALWKSVGPEAADNHIDPDLDQFLNTNDPPYDWLIENLIERGDRIIITGQEGHGKSTLLRQMALQFATGINPFTHDQIEPLQVLIVDCENSSRQARRALTKLRPNAPNYQPGKLRLRILGHALELAHTDARNDLAQRIQTQAVDILIIGPLYKLIDDDPTKELPARAVADTLDMLRNIRGTAILIEAHSPYAEGTKTRRPIRPYGASLWSRWPEFGIYLAQDGKLEHWRGQRDERSWPTALQRSTPWPWTTNTNTPPPPQEWNGPTECIKAVTHLINELGHEITANKLCEEMRARQLGYRDRTVRDSARIAANNGHIRHRLGPRSSDIYSPNSDGQQPAIGDPYEHPF